MPKKRKILLVEDDLFLADLYQTNLEVQGYKVDHARDGAIACRKISRSKYDLILLDLLLPKVNGFKVLEKIRKHQSQKPRCCVIVLTNLSQTEEMKKGEKMGADEYLIKANFTPQEIIDKIKTRLS